MRLPGEKTYLLTKTFSWDTHPFSTVLSLLPAKLNNLLLVCRLLRDGKAAYNQSGVCFLFLQLMVTRHLFCNSVPQLLCTWVYHFVTILFFPFPLGSITPVIPQWVLELCSEENSDTNKSLSSIFLFDVPASKHLSIWA